MTHTKSLPIIYATYYPSLVEVAREFGYALAIHGSLTRDCDLIAVSWTEEAKEPVDLIKKMAETIGANKYEASYYAYHEKPHGRQAYMIQCGAGGYFDISVIPPRR